MPDLVNIAVSGLVNHQNALSTAGHNIANISNDAYSRQEVDFASAPATSRGDFYMGNGTTLEGVRRIVDSFLVGRLRSDTVAFHETDAYYGNAARVDNMLASDSTGISAPLQDFFSSMQFASSEPSSIPVRQVLLSKSELLVKRFNTLYEQLETHNTTLNQQMTSAASEVNVLARGIAELNLQLTSANSNALSAPNDLFDQREELTRQLAEKIGITVVEQNNGSVNISVGRGNPLVVGEVSNELGVTIGESDANRRELSFVTSRGSIEMSDVTTGGELGGILAFRREILDPAFRDLGLVAIAFADSINTQHRLGIDSDGELGGDYFQSINGAVTSVGRVIGDSANALPSDRVVNVTIDDISQLTTSNYELSFPGPGNNFYSLRRLDDNTILSTGVLSGAFPTSISADGMSVNLVSGSFQQGDLFTLQPTRYGSRDIAMQIKKTNDLAFGQPIRAEANSANQGTGSIVSTSVTDTTTSAFATSGQLSPPLIVRFNSTTSYDVLDYSDPSNIVDLVPPIYDQSFVPGFENNMLPPDLNQTAVTSEGAQVGVAVLGGGNGYSIENFSLNTIDPVTGVTSLQVWSSSANDSANAIAQGLSANLLGVSAQAKTKATLNNFAGPLTVSVNGVAVVGATASSLATSINADPTLQGLRIRAVVDGTDLIIHADDGLDISVANTGGGGANVDVNGVATAAAATALVGGQIDVVLDEGATLSTGGAGVFTVSPTSNSRSLGYQMVIKDTPTTGDTFFVQFNDNASSDNRNALALSAIESIKITEGSTKSIGDTYASVVEVVGSLTNEARIALETRTSLMRQSQSDRDAVSGVNLDEEAAKLIQYEVAYNANAQVISVARSLFDTLIGAFG